MKKSGGDAIYAIVQNLSHDVKTPLTSVLGFTQLLLEDAGLTAKQREYLEMIESDAKRLDEIVHASVANLNSVLGTDSK